MNKIKNCSNKPLTLVQSGPFIKMSADPYYRVAPFNGITKIRAFITVKIPLLRTKGSILLQGSKQKFKF